MKKINSKLKFKVHDFKVLESDKDSKWIKIGGTALTPLTSRNGVTYTVDNINELDGSKTKFFMTHDLDPKNVVGHVTFTKESDTLRYDAEIRNTDTWTDVTEMAKDKFFEVSIDARYDKLHRIKSKESDDMKYTLSGMEMRGLCGVGVGGVPTNTVDYAIEEEIRKIDKKNVNEKSSEVDKLEEEKLKQVASENEELKKELNALKAKEADRAVAAVNKLKEEIGKLNKELDLSNKDVKELELILSYEQKLSKEEEDPVEEKPAEEPEAEEGKGEVADDVEEAKTEEQEVVIEKDGSIGFGSGKSFNNKMYKDFNAEIRKQI